MNLPSPDCRWGYTENQLNQILGDNLSDFHKWMNGQTVAFCEGRAYNHDKKEYYEVCDGVHHGVVVYKWDLERFLNGLPVID